MHCEKCERISALHQQFRANRQRFAMMVNLDEGLAPLSRVVRTWCRKCGGPITIDIGTMSYNEAKKRLGDIHCVAMEHEGYFHTEIGGCWGWMWRFDDVLEAAFPAQYFKELDAPLWPMPSGYPYHPGAEAKPVEMIRDPENEIEEDMDRRRRELAHNINDDPRERGELTLEYGRVWDNEELREEFEVVAFRTPFIICKRIETGELGTMLFQCNPRYYFNFQADAQSS